MGAQPWVVTRDATLWARIERIAAAADVAVYRSEAVDDAGSWRSAPMVVVDAACLDEVAAAHLPERSGIVVLATRPLSTGEWERCVRLGARHVLGPGGFDAELIRLLADAGGAAANGAGNIAGKVVAVLGACGGAGATVLATAVAMRAQRAGWTTLLCDADPLGAGIDLAVGLEDSAGARWGDISVSSAAPAGRLPLESLYRALPRTSGGRSATAVLTYRRDGATAVGVDVVASVLDSVTRAGDLAVVDLPRAPLPVADHVVSRADLTVLVVPADVRGCYSAARAVGRLAGLDASLGLVVRGPSPGGIGADDIAATLQLPLVAAMRPQPGLDRALDAGHGATVCMRGPLRAAAAAVLREVGLT